MSFVDKTLVFLAVHHQTVAHNSKKGSFMPQFFIFLVLFFTVALHVSAGCNLPLELRKIADKNGCKEIVDFMDRPAMVDPPYVYGYLKGNKEDSAVFWCQSKSESNLYKLVIYSKNNSAFKCPTVIETRNYPGGLSLFSDRARSLSEFKYISNDMRGPKIKGLQNNFIMSYYDGVESIYYCHDGKWLNLFRH